MKTAAARNLSLAVMLLLATAAGATVLDNVDHETSGVSSPLFLAISPDGAFLYSVNGNGNNGLSVYERDLTPGPGYGSLDFVQSYSGDNSPCTSNMLKSATSVVISPDGLNLYVTSRPTGKQNTLSSWSRDTNTGALECIQRVVDNTNLRRSSGLSISPDGSTVYLTTTTAKQERVTAFSRDSGTGLLSFLQSIRDNTGGANFLNQPSSTAVSPNGEQVYVTSAGESAITRFARNIAGSLSLPLAEVDNQGANDGLQGTSRAAVSADGAHVYTAAPAEDEVGIFERDGTDGSLDFVGVRAHNVGGVTGLDGVTGVAVSPDGAHVFAAAVVSGALTVFGRDPSTGQLAFLAAITDPGNLDGARFVAVSPDSRCVYVAAQAASNIEAYCFAEEDFGDAPAPYATLAVDAGARHTLDAAAYLGAGVPDTETDGQPSALADGDDLAGTDDEDGVTLPGTPILAGEEGSVGVAGNGVVDGWIDFNGDGDFNDEGENVFTGVSMPGSPTFTAPELTLDGFTIGRFRARATGSAALAAEGGGGDGDVEDYRVELSSESFQVAVTLAGNGSGTVTSTPAGIDCGTECLQPFADGEDVHLDAAPATGSDFTGWTGASAAECTGTTCDFDDLAENKAVTATFTLQTFQLTVAVTSGNGTIDDVGDNLILCGTGGVDCTETYDYGTDVQLHAVPDAGWLFTGWTGGCTNVVGDCVVDITQATSVQATFALDVFLLTVDPEAGTGTGTVRITNTGDNTFIDCTPEVPTDPDCTHFYANGTQLALTATADPDSQFVEWTGDCNGANCNLTMNQSHSVGAVFELYPDLRVVINDDRVSLPGNGGTVTIVVTVSSVGLVDPSGNATITSLPMTNVTNVTWTCAATDTVCENANGVGVLDESVAMPSGSQLVFTFTGTAPTPALGEVATSATVVNPDPELPPNQADNTDTGTFFYHQIFRDGFESGNHGAWSTHFPLP